MSIAAVATAGSKVYTALSSGARKMAADTVKAVNSQVGVMASFNNALTSALEPLTLITEPIEYLGEIIGTGLYPLLQPFSDALYALGPIIEPLVDQISGELAPVMAELAPIITMLAPPIINIIGIMISSFIPVLQAIIPAIMPIIPTLAELITALTPLVPAIMPIMFPILNLTGLFVELTPILVEIMPHVTSLVRILGTFVPVIANVISVVSPFFTNFWGTMLGFIMVGWDGVVNWFKSVPQQIVNAIITSSVNIKEALQDWWESLWD